MKNYILIFPITLLILAAFSGCEQGKDDIITGEHFIRKPGDLKSVTIHSDSIRILSVFEDNIGYNERTLAGRYKNVSAFSVFKFTKPSQSVIDSLISATLILTVRDVWKEGDCEFGIFSTATSWSDTARLDPDQFLPQLSAPITVASDTAKSFVSLNFALTAAEFNSWGEYGAFLVKNTDNGFAMVSIASDNSTKPPACELIFTNLYGFTDTTVVKSVEGTYFSMTELDRKDFLISESNATGFILYFGLPDFAQPPTAINQCNLTLLLRDNLMVTNAMTVSLYRLTKAYTTPGVIETDSQNSKSLSLTPDVSSYTIDISKFIDAWHNYKNPNYGILFKYSSLSTVLNYAIIEPSDSLVITYTSMPEME